MDINHYERFPKMRLLSITGGEPFIRKDLSDIIDIVRPKAKRILISTNGYFTERIVSLAKKYKDIAFRISMEGLPRINDEVRGTVDGFDHAFRTILKLKQIGAKDIGINVTINDNNIKDLIELYFMAKHLGIQFSTSIVHNGYSYHKFDNKIDCKDEITDALRKLIKMQLNTGKQKDWFRAYLNYGIINFVNGNKRLLPCIMGQDKFLCEPWGDIKPCNMMDETMGNITQDSFETIWQSRQADDVREKLKTCNKQCWQAYNAGQIMSRMIWVPAIWVLCNKWKRKINV